MKKMLYIMPLLILFVISAVSAVMIPDTIVGGIIYDVDANVGVSGAKIKVACNHSNILNIQNTTSESDGTYAVAFSDTECTAGDNVIVYAKKGDLNGIGEGVVQDYGLTINLAIVNVPMVPEFGLIIGLATLLGAMGIVFVVRKE